MGIMWSEEGRVLSGEQAAPKKRKAVNPNLSKAQKFPVETNLSRQYDNDGNPYPAEPSGYTTTGGH